MRGVIMSVEGSKAVLLTQGGDFKQIRNKNYNVGDKVKVTTNYAARIGSIAAALAVFAIGGGASYFIPASYVSVDINPSFLMTLNVYDKVINIEPLNDEAKAVLKHTDVKGMDINDTVDAIISESKQVGYINDNGADVIVSVVPRMRTPKIEDKNKADNVNLVISGSDKQELEDAKKMGVSIAKAKAIEDYTVEFDGTISDNANKLSGKTIRQIESEIEEKKKAAPTQHPAETASPQANGSIALQSVAQPASPAESKSAQRQTAKAAPNPTAAPAQIFTPQQMFMPAPAKDSGNSDMAPEQKVEEVKTEIKQETPKAKAETDKPQNNAPLQIPTQLKTDEQDKKIEQPSGTQAEPKPQNSEPSTPVQSENGQNNGAAPTRQKEPEQKDTVPSEPTQRQPEQKENVPLDGGNAAPSDNGGATPSNYGNAPSQPSVQGGGAPQGGGNAPSGGNSGSAPSGGNGGGGPR